MPDNEIEGINKLLAKAVSEFTEWQRTCEILNSVLGVGDGVTFVLLGEFLSWVSYHRARLRRFVGWRRSIVIAAS